MNRFFRNLKKKFKYFPHASHNHSHDKSNNKATFFKYSFVYLEFGIICTHSHTHKCKGLHYDTDRAHKSIMINSSPTVGVLSGYTD
jgi:hypothetical protein